MTQPQISIKQQAVSGVRWTSLSAGVNTLIIFIQTAVLAHLLSPLDFGLMGLVMIVVNFAQLFSDMGISNAIIHRQDTTKEQLSSLYWFNIAIGAFVTFIVIILAPLIAVFYHEARLKGLILSISAIFLITSFGQQFQTLLQKELRFKFLAWSSMLGYFVNAIVALICALAGLGVYSLIWGQLANTLVRMIIVISYGSKRWTPGIYFSWTGLKGYINYGLFQIGDKTADYFNGYLIQILLGSLAGARALGYYTLAYDLAFRPIQVINPIITRVALPVFSKLQNDSLKAKRGYFKIISLLSAVNFPLTLSIAVMASIAVPLIYGEQWYPSIILIKILAVAALFYSIGSPLNALLLAKGRADISFAWNISKILLYAPILYLGVKFYGVVGGTLVFSILIFLTSTLAAYFFLLKPIFGPCMRNMMAGLMPSLWLSAATAGIILLVNSVCRSFPPISILILQIGAGFTVYVYVLFHYKKDLAAEIKSFIFGRV